MVTEMKSSTLLDVSHMGHSGVLEILLNYPELNFNLPTAPEFYREVRTYFIGMMNGLIAKANVFDMADCDTIIAKRRTIMHLLNQCANNHSATREEIHTVAAEIGALEKYIDDTIAALPPMDYAQLKTRVQNVLDAEVDFKNDLAIRQPYAELEAYLQADDAANYAVMNTTFITFLDGASHALAKLINLVQGLIDQQREVALEAGIYRNPVVHMQFMRHEKRLQQLLSGRDVPQIIIDLNELTSLIDNATVQQQLIDHLLVSLRERFNGYQAAIAEFDITDFPEIAQHVEGLKTQFAACFLPTTVQMIGERLDALAAAMQNAKIQRESEAEVLTDELTQEVAVLQTMIEEQRLGRGATMHLGQFVTTLNADVSYTELCELQTAIKQFHDELDAGVGQVEAETSGFSSLQIELMQRLRDINIKAQAQGYHREISELLVNAFSAVVDLERVANAGDVANMADELSQILTKLIEQSDEARILMARLTARQAIFQYQQVMNGNTEQVDEVAQWSTAVSEK